MTNEPNMNKIIPNEALIVARKWLKENEPTAKEDSATKSNENMRITRNPEIRPSIKKLYSPSDVIRKAIEDDPVASKLPKSGKAALLKALGNDPDVKKNIG